jgi:hypothetical protein
MQVVCAHCGGRFEAKRSTAKYCSDQHRMSAAKARRSSGNVVPLAPAAGKKRTLRIIESTPTEGPLTGPVDSDPPTEIRDVTDAIKRTYRRQLDSPMGQVALKLARLLDRGGSDDHCEALSRELRQVTMAMDARAAADDQDEDPVSRARRRHHGS